MQRYDTTRYSIFTCAQIIAKAMAILVYRTAQKQKGLESLRYCMVKKIAENFNRLSMAHQRHRQTTDDRQTDGSAIAYSNRNVYVHVC